MTTTAVTAEGGAVAHLPLTLNRHQRRAAKARMKVLGHFDRHNGIAQATLTPAAYDRLVSLLEGHGNNLDGNHRAALMALVGLMTKMAQGQLRGRWAFGLPTGLGKTSAIIAWCAALNSIGADHISVAVSASKVEALCNLKRDLIKQGVPAEKIGLVHSYEYDASKIKEGQPLPVGYASEPSDGEGRQIMLVTHARVRGCDLSTFNTYKGKPRDLLIYDESLMVSDSLGIPFRDLKGAVGFLAKYDDSETHAPLIAYLTECRDRIGRELERQKTSNDGEGLIRLPETTASQVEGFKALLGRHAALAVARSLLEIAHEDVRVITTGQGGVIHYEVSVPKELGNVLVLDASFPVRKLARLDRSVKDAEHHLPEIKRIGVPLSSLKRFDQVTIHQMFAGGGRNTMLRDFEKPDDSRKVTREVVEVVRQVPADETVLVFTYLERPLERMNYRRTLLRDLDKAGIDTETKVNGKPRINVVTWGMETNLNDYAHCSHVVLAGVLQRSPVDIAAAYLGQINNLTATVSAETVKELHVSETVHMIYQALSRGSCRVIDNGHAKPMTAWIIHRDPLIRAGLEKVMPGAVWQTWERRHGGKPTEGTIARTAVKLADYLRGLPQGTDKVSVREVKKALGLEGLLNRTFQLARDAAFQLVPWHVERRTLVRTFG